jgi:uncharacterized membrane protein (UPF0127 family)
MIQIKRTSVASAAGRRDVVRRPAAAAASAAWLVAAAALATLAPMPGAAQSAGQPPLQTIELSSGMHRIVAEVAATPRQQQMGLMFRQRMGPNEGMLFVYEQPQPHCFWMRNTVLPLTIAFVDDRGVIVDLKDMQPQTDDSHCSSKPVRFALEMNQGWFAKRRIDVGARLRGAPFTP